MAYVALKRIRFGDGWLDPGDPVPVEAGRNYQMMVYIGEVAEVPDEPAKKPAGGKPPPKSAGKQPAKKPAGDSDAE